MPCHAKTNEKGNEIRKKPTKLMENMGLGGGAAMLASVLPLGVTF